MSPLTDDQNASRRMLGISIDTALMVHGFELLSPEQVECLMDPEREPEARGMVMDIADRVITSPTVSDFLHRVLAECLPVDPNDPDEGTAAYGGWDHDRDVADAEFDMPAFIAQARQLPAGGPSDDLGLAAQLRHAQQDRDPTVPAYNGIMADRLARLVDEFQGWLTDSGWDVESCGDATEILMGGKDAQGAPLSAEARAYLKRFIERWEAAELEDEREHTAKGEARAQAVWLDRMGMGPVKVLP